VKRLMLLSFNTHVLIRMMHVTYTCVVIIIVDKTKQQINFCDILCKF